ncbi:chloride channel protein, partial [Desulfocurvibacter africanus]
MDRDRSTDTQPDDAAHSVSGNAPGRMPDDIPGLTGQSGKTAAITNSPLALLLRYFRFGRDILRSYRQISHVRWLLIGIGVGVLSGLGAVLFYLAVEGGKHLFLTVLAGLSLPAPSGEALFHAAGHGGRQAS